jgi:hypothetical protein
VLAGRAALRDAAVAALNSFQTERLTTVLRLAGRAMAPTLNPGTLRSGGSGETLLVRRLPAASARHAIVARHTATRHTR